jgi:hypothetical protein
MAADTPMPGTPQVPDQVATSPDMLPPVPQARKPHAIALQELKAKVAGLVRDHQVQQAQLRQGNNPTPVPLPAEDQPGADARMRFGGVPGVTTAGVPGVAYTNDYAAYPNNAAYESVPVNRLSPRLSPPELTVRSGMEAQGGHTDYTPSGRGYSQDFYADLPDDRTGARFYRPPGANYYQPGVTPLRIADGSAGPRSVAELGHVNSLLEGEDSAADRASASKQGMYSGPTYSATYSVGDSRAQSAPLRPPLYGPNDELMPRHEVPGVPDPQWPFFDPRKASGAALEGIAGSGMAGEAINALASPARYLASLARSAPKTTAATLAGGTFAANAGEAGDDPRAQAALRQSQDDRQAMIDAGKQLDTALEQRKSLDQQRAIAVADRDAELRGTGGKTAGRGPVYNAKDAEVARLSGEMERLDATIADLRKRSSPEYAAYMAKIREAEAVRQDILDSSRKPFEQAHPDWASRQWLIPGSVAALTAIALRAPGTVSALGQAGRWWGAIRAARDVAASPAARADARILAERLEQEMPAKTWQDTFKAYATPALIGSTEGAALSNTPEFYNLFLPPKNPERLAYEEYMKRLPDGAPEIARTVELLKTLPEDNPARKAALAHFGDIKPAIVRAVSGAGEGFVGAFSGTTLSKVPGPYEAGLPRAETRALIDAAAARRRLPPGPGPQGPPVVAPPVAPPAAPPVESWQSPSGTILKRGKSGDTWHDEKGNFRSPPPPGSKRISWLDDFTGSGSFG